MRLLLLLVIMGLTGCLSTDDIGSFGPTTLTPPPGVELDVPVSVLSASVDGTGAATTADDQAHMTFNSDGSFTIGMPDGREIDVAPDDQVASTGGLFSTVPGDTYLYQTATSDTVEVFVPAGSQLALARVDTAGTPAGFDTYTAVGHTTTSATLPTGQFTLRGIMAAGLIVDGLGADLDGNGTMDGGVLGTSEVLADFDAVGGPSVDVTFTNFLLIGGGINPIMPVPGTLSGTNMPMSPDGNFYAGQITGDVAGYNLDGGVVAMFDPVVSFSMLAASGDGVVLLGEYWAFGLDALVGS